MRASRLILAGRVQGVGFRPFIYRLAHELGLNGWVLNRGGQVEVHIQGPAPAMQRFERDAVDRAPPLAQARLLSSRPAETEDLEDFRILASRSEGSPRIHVPPDFFCCDDCLRELEDPADRRHRYPFINCTQCGPRYTLIRALPYDRPNTTMAGFPLCPDCHSEYLNPLDRRFHAEPVACADCGPRLRFHVPGQAPIDGNEPALAACIHALDQGRIVAVKGIGGYHLLCDAANDQAVRRLRANKPRPHKPLALMFPLLGEDGLDMVRRHLAPTEEQARLLTDPMRPIVLTSVDRPHGLSDAIAPGLDEVGVMLPYSPLHHLLLKELKRPLVATSANPGGEPVLTGAEEVERRLPHVAEAFLHHNRPIQRPADDPVFRVIAGRPRPIRLGRGCAPLERELPFHLPRPVLATGSHMKNTVALAWEDRVVVSPHIGDMDTPRGLEVFEQVITDLQALYGVRARSIVCDAHPGFTGTRWAEGTGLPVHRVLHHHAHASAVAGEFPGAEPWLVFTWDGTGFGGDGTLWGGEALLGRPGRWRRLASLRPFRLPGGERAAREAWRCALGVCWESGREWPSAPGDTALLHNAWQRRINSPQTTAAGRLFDAAAALTGVLQSGSFEGQGPMYLEALAEAGCPPMELPLRREGSGLLIADWAPLLPLLMDESVPVARRSGVFHASLAGLIADMAGELARQHRFARVGLAGGVFQNRLLAADALRRLRKAGFDAVLPEAVPVNDAGISYGQVVEFAGGQGAA